MKKHTLTLLLTFAIAILPLAAQEAALPSADDLFSKYISASGGKEALLKITSRSAKGTIEVVTFGASGDFVLLSKEPNLQVMNSEFAGYGEVSQGFDGKVAWASRPDQGYKELTGDEAVYQKRGADFHGTLHLKDQYKKLTVTGKAKVGERGAYVVEGVPVEASNPEKLYFDTQSGLLLRQDVTVTTPSSFYFEDYKEVDGVKIPFTIRNEGAEISVVIKISEVKNNIPLEDSKFVKPAK